MITRLTIEGFKGAQHRTLALGALTLVTGDNGTGKSAVIEAVDFALGRPVCGSSADGGELRDALDGDVLSVIAETSEDDVIERRRIVDRGTFKKATISFNDASGEEAVARIAAALGDVSPPRGQTWLTMSTDKLSAELAKLGADADAAEKALALVEAYDVALRKKVQGTTPSAQIAEARELAKTAVNGARAAAKAVEGSTDRSRSAQAEDEAVTPERLVVLTEAAQAAERALEAASAAEARLTSAGRASREALQRWTATAAALDDDVARARAAAASVVTVEAPDEATVSRAQRALAEARSARVELTEEAQAAREGLSIIAERVATAVARVEAMAGISSLLDQAPTSPHCPMCAQPISPDVARVLSADLAARRDVLDAVVRERAAAAEYLNDVNGQITAVVKDLNAAETAMAALERQQAASAAAERGHATAAALAEAAWARAERWRAENPKPALVEDDPALAAEAAERTALARQALQDARHTLTLSSAAAERYKRWRDDLQARKAAADKVAAAEKLLDGVRGIEEGLVAGGARRLVDGMLDYVPNALGRPDVWRGQIGLRRDGDFIGGVGLSTAQQVTLAMAIDRSLDALTGRRLRIVSLEADALDARSLDHVMAACESAVAMGDLDQAIIATCHPPRDVGPDWLVIRTSPEIGPPPVPSGGFDPERLAQLDAVYAAKQAAALPPPVGETVSMGFPPLAVATADRPKPVAVEGVVTVPADDARDVQATVEKPATTVVVEPPPPGTADWLWRPGQTLGDNPEPSVVAQIIDSLGAEALAELRAWPANGPKPFTRGMVMSVAAGDELRAKKLLAGDDVLTGAGLVAWRILVGVEPPEPPKTAAQEEQAAKTALRMLDGVGLTFEEVVAIIKPLSADALRHLGITRAGLAGTMKATAPIWRKHIAEAFQKRGYDRDSVCRWTKDAAESFPKRSRGAAAEAGDDKPETEETGAVVAPEDGGP